MLYSSCLLLGVMVLSIGWQEGYCKPKGKLFADLEVNFIIIIASVTSQVPIRVLFYMIIILIKAMAQTYCV